PRGASALRRSFRRRPTAGRRRAGGRAAGAVSSNDGRGGARSTLRCIGTACAARGADFAVKGAHNVNEAQRITGVLSPVVTPFKNDLSPDAVRFVRQCRWLLAQNVGLAVFGTNSEANSL